MEFVLASKSPRRVEMLKSLGFDFTVRPADIDESSISIADPETGVEKIALEKAKACFHGLEMHEAVVLAADTIVVLDGEVLLKPKDAADARAMLSKLSGKTHTVFTGVAIMTERETRSFVESTDVTFFELTDEEIDDYIATGEPLDKAGAYGIQGRGSLLVKSINGDYFNVVGLPTAPVARCLKAFGVLPQKGV
ncbi:MAG: septum formation inhibitor Maf [Clostridia bacterium]|nr:septum formation inhibitor Maf [Clostridia bacterium]